MKPLAVNKVEKSSGRASAVATANTADATKLCEESNRFKESYYLSPRNLRKAVVEAVGDARAVY